MARALAARGETPVLATAAEYRELVESAGIAFAPVRPGFAPFGDYQALLRKIFDVRHGVRFIVRDIVMPHLRVAYEDLGRAAEGAALLVSHPLTVTLPLIAEQRRLPWASVILSPASLMSSYDPPVIAGAEWLHALQRLGRVPYQLVFSVLRLITRRWEAPLRAFRQEIGLPPQQGLAMLEGQFSPRLNLALFDAPLVTPQPDWPENLTICGAALHDGTLSPNEREGLESFLAAGEPPLVFALGSSAVWVAGDFWQHAIEATRALGRRAILVTGRDTPTRIRELPPGIAVFGYLPYSMVFPRALAVIHQAGIGTLSQALRSARPQLIVPFAFDQPDNAHRAAALGLARVLPLKKLNGAMMARELHSLLADAQYAGRAADVSRRLEGVNGAERAAEALASML